MYLRDNLAFNCRWRLFDETFSRQGLRVHLDVDLDIVRCQQPNDASGVHNRTIGNGCIAAIGDASSEAFVQRPSKLSNFALHVVAVAGDPIDARFLTLICHQPTVEQWRAVENPTRSNGVIARS